MGLQIDAPHGAKSCEAGDVFTNFIAVKYETSKHTHLRIHRFTLNNSCVSSETSSDFSDHILPIRRRLSRWTFPLASANEQQVSQKSMTEIEAHQASEAILAHLSPYDNKRLDIHFRASGIDLMSFLGFTIDGIPTVETKKSEWSLSMSPEETANLIAQALDNPPSEPQKWRIIDYISKVIRAAQAAEEAVKLIESDASNVSNSPKQDA